MRFFLAVFFLVTLFLSSFFIDLWENANTTSHVLPVVAYAETGNIRIDKYKDYSIDYSFVNDHYYSDKAPLPSFFVIPFFKGLQLLGFIPEHDGSLYGKHVYAIGGFLCGSLPFALMVFLAFYSIRKREGSLSPVVLAMLPFFGSFLFVFSGTFFGHLFAAILLLIGYNGLREKKWILAGLFTGLAFMSDYPIALALCFWPVQIWMKERNLKSPLLFVAGALVPVLILLSYNFLITGSPFHLVSRYLAEFWEDQNWRNHYGFSLPDAGYLFTILFTKYRGMFVFAPVLGLLVFQGIRRAVYTTFLSLFSNYLILFSIAFVLIISGRGPTCGGWTYGPRYLIPIAMLFIYQGVQIFKETKWSLFFFWTLSLLGLLAAFLAKATVLYSLPSEEMNPLTSVVFPEFMAKHIQSNNILTQVYGIEPLNGWIIFVLLFVLSVAVLSSWHRKISIEVNSNLS